MLIRLLKFAPLFIFLGLISSVSFAQKGKNGALNITSNTTSINSSTTLSADAAVGATSISVTSNPGIGAGDLVLIIQMQGATIKSTLDNTWGEILNYNSAGLNEFAEVSSAGTNTINFSCALKNNYSAAGKVQVIQVPRYSSFSITAGDTLRPAVWNGTTGGILAMEVSGNVTINGVIDATGRGFRGGSIAGDNQAAFPGTNFVASKSPLDGAEKGEGIAGYGATYDNLFGGRYSYGAAANGGGGGASHNAGGGGGGNGGAVGAWTGAGNPDNSNANYISAWNAEAPGFAASTSSGGGRGGYSFVYFQPGTTPVNPLIYGPGNAAYTFTDNKRNVGGKGGRPLDYSGGRIFFGGGGGAGDGNDGIATNGGKGGGLIYIKTCGNISGSGGIITNGTAGDDAYAAGGNDAPGGGGAGGTVVLNAQGNITGSFTITANGGRGGNQKLSINQLEAEGPGGGGGGGVVLLTGGAITTSVAGGPNGVTDAPAVNPFLPNGATKGGTGTVSTISKSVSSGVSVLNRTICYGDTARLNAYSGGTVNPNVIWYADSLGKKIRKQGSPFTTPRLYADTVYYVGTLCSADACGSSKLIPDTVFVRSVKAEAGRDTSFCSGGSALIGAKTTPGYTYQWSPATGLSSTTISSPVASPVNTTLQKITINYILITKLNACADTDTVAITIDPIPKPEAGTDTTFCSGGKKILGTDSVPGFSYLWSPSTGLNNTKIAKPSVTRTNISSANVTTTYYVTVSFNKCIAKDSVRVTVRPIPGSDAGPDRSFCSGGKSTLGTTITGGVNNAVFSWLPVTGLSNPTIPDPEITLTNTTNDSITTPYILTTTSMGCSTTDTVKVTVRPIPIANAGKDTSFCSGGSAFLGTTSNPKYTYLWTPSSNLSNSTISNPLLTRNNINTANITTKYIVDVNAFRCSSRDTVAVTVRPNPVANAGNDTVFCSGGHKILGTGPTAGYQYSWTPANFLSSTIVSNPTMTEINTGATPITTRYFLTATANGCISKDSVDVTVKPIPLSDAGLDTGFCSGGNAPLGSALVPGNIYSWSPSIGLSATSISNPSVTRTNANTNDILITNYVVTTTGPNGCSSTDTVNVSVRPIPVSFAGRDTTICSGGKISLGTLPTVRYSYAWSPAVGLNSTSISDPVLTILNKNAAPLQTTFKVTTTAYNCTTSDSVTITVNPLPVSLAGRDTGFCSGGTASIGDATISGYSYSWSPSKGLNRTDISNPSATLTNTFSAPLVSNYILTTSLRNCSMKDTVAITVSPLPDAFAGADKSFCSGDSAKLGKSSIQGYIYSWTPTTGLSNSAISNPVTSIKNTGTNPLSSDYILTTTFFGCVDADTVKIIVNPIPLSDAGQDKTFCSGANANLGSAAVSGYSYKWDPPFGLNNITIANPNVKRTNYSSIPVSTLYIVTTNSNNCSSADTVKVTINPGPKPDAGADKSFCSGGNALIGSNSTVGYSYSWSPATGLNTTTTSNPTTTLSNNTTTPVTIEYIVTTTSFSCVDKDTVKVTVNPIPVANAGLDTSYCNGSLPAIGSASTPGYKYSWSPAGGLTNPAISNPVVSLTNTTNSLLTVKYTVTTTAYSCTASDTVVIKVNPATVSEAGDPLPDYCGFSPNVKIGTDSITGLTYSWSPATGLSDPTISNPRVFFNNPGSSILTRTYTVTTNNTFNCPSTDNITFTVYPVISAEASPDVETCRGAESILNASGANIVKWSNGETTHSISVNPFSTTTYYVTLSNGVCTAKDSVTVNIKNSIPINLFIPNAFTPTQDDVNEVFKVVSDHKGIKEFSGKIFNRWGELYYEWTDIKEGWNGFYQGALVQQDVYVYQVDVKNVCDDNIETRRGTVAVER